MTQPALIYLTAGRRQSPNQVKQSCFSNDIVNTKILQVQQLLKFIVYPHCSENNGKKEVCHKHILGLMCTLLAEVPKTV